MGSNPNSSEAAAPLRPPPITDSHYPYLGKGKLIIKPCSKKKPWKAALFTRLKKSDIAEGPAVDPIDDSKDRQAIEMLRATVQPPTDPPEVELEEDHENDDLASFVSDSHADGTGEAFSAPFQNKNPWLKNAGNFINPPAPTKEDLALNRYEVNLVNETLVFDEDDITPLHTGWGYSLLGFFAGKFPGKYATQNLVNGWIRTPRISYHQKGWIVFRFDTEENMECVRQNGPYSVYGTPLILYHMPANFRFESAPESKFPVWAYIPNLPLELWNRRAIGKIASLVGCPIEVDAKTVAKTNIDGPRFHVLVDAFHEPREGIHIKLPCGTAFFQAIKFDFYPRMCSRCGRLGHFVKSCVANLEFANKTKRGSHPSVGGFFANYRNGSRPPQRDERWQAPPRGGDRGQNRNRSVSRAPPNGRDIRNRSNSRAANPRTRWVSKTGDGAQEKQPAKTGDGGQEKQTITTSKNLPNTVVGKPTLLGHKNAHVYFESPHALNDETEPLELGKSKSPTAIVEKEAPPPFKEMQTHHPAFPIGFCIASEAEDESTSVDSEDVIVGTSGLKAPANEQAPTPIQEVESSCTLGSNDTISEFSSYGQIGTPLVPHGLPLVSAPASNNAGDKLTPAAHQESESTANYMSNVPARSNVVEKDVGTNHPSTATAGRKIAHGKNKKSPNKKKGGKGGNSYRRFK